MGNVRLAALVVGLIVLSGVGDAQGFIHASTMWRDGRLQLRELILSALGFAVGIGCYWVAVRYLSEAGIVSAELQTLLWFGVTLAGVALLGGEIASWRRIDQLVALGVMLGIGWLLVGTGANPSDGR